MYGKPKCAKHCKEVEGDVPPLEDRSPKRIGFALQSVFRYYESGSAT
jgi:hypothetical protein